jgi:hypothetical protein
VPVDIGIDVDVPPVDGGGGESGQILDSSFDGAFFGGIVVSNREWRIESHGIWAGFGGDRPERPFLDVDLDVIYGGAKLERRVASSLYVTAGVRRVALDYDITLADLPRLSRKPGVWNPLVGVAWRSASPKWEWHAAFEGGGFGVGADVDLGGSFRMEWRMARHFGLTAGYHVLYLKVSDEVAGRTVVLEPTVHGPLVGFALYF